MAIKITTSGQKLSISRENEYLRRQRDLEQSRENPLGGPAEQCALIDLMRDAYSMVEPYDALVIYMSAYYAVAPGFLLRDLQNPKLN